jgi:hypothetical protein
MRSYFRSIGTLSNDVNRSKALGTHKSAGVSFETVGVIAVSQQFPAVRSAAHSRQTRNFIGAVGPLALPILRT